MLHCLWPVRALRPYQQKTQGIRSYFCLLCFGQETLGGSLIFSTGLHYSSAEVTVQKVCMAANWLSPFIFAVFYNIFSGTSQTLP